MSDYSGLYVSLIKYPEMTEQTENLTPVKEHWGGSWGVNSNFLPPNMLIKRWRV